MFVVACVALICVCVTLVWGLYVSTSVYRFVSLLSYTFYVLMVLICCVGLLTSLLLLGFWGFACLLFVWQFSPWVFVFDALRLF